MLRTALLLLACALPVTALAGPIVTDTFGGTASSNTGQRTYKLNTYDIDEAVKLLHIAPYLTNPPGAQVEFVVYRQAGNVANQWALEWNSGPTTLAGGTAYKTSPAINLDLTVGERYALGIIILGDGVTYAYDGNVGAEPVAWGGRVSSVWSQNNQTWTIPDPLWDSESDAGYAQQITVEFTDVSGTDADNDGYPTSLDCDDNDATVYPGATEICDGKDQDCDGVPDDGLSTGMRWPDADGDGFGDENAPGWSGCGTPPPNSVDNDWDCDDTDPSTYDGAQEVCDGVDNNCNGMISPDEQTDNDSDGYPVCNDCDDDVAAVNPGVVEDPCDTTVDADCDGVIPDGSECDTGDTGDTGPVDTGDTGPVDTNDTGPGDTDDTESGEEEGIRGAGCSCSSGIGVPGGALPALLVLGTAVLVSRRRRSEASQAR